MLKTLRRCFNEARLLIVVKIMMVRLGSSLRQRKCPNPGRYVVLGLAPFHLSSTPFRRQRRNERRSSRIIKRRTWNEDTQQKAHEQQKHHHHHHHHHREHGELQQQQQERHGEDCRSANVQIGCTLPNQSEIIIEKTCDREETSKWICLHCIIIKFCLFCKPFTVCE